MIRFGKKKETKEPGKVEVSGRNKKANYRVWVIAGIVIAIAIGGALLLDLISGKFRKEAPTEVKVKTVSAVPEKPKEVGQSPDPFKSLKKEEEKVSGAGKGTPEAIDYVPPKLDKMAAIASIQKRSGGTGNAPREVRKPTVSGFPENAPPAAPASPITPEPPAAFGSPAVVTAARLLKLDPDLYIPVDTRIPCAMMDQFISEVSGPIRCQISEDIWSASRNVKLIKAGTVARGFYTGVEGGKSRMMVGVTELRTPEPNAMVIPMLNTQAVGQLGANGVTGHIDRHYLQRIGTSYLIAGFADLLTLGTEYLQKEQKAKVTENKDGSTTTETPTRRTNIGENTLITTGAVMANELGKNLSIPDTLTLNQGDIIGLRTGADIDFSQVYKLAVKE